MPISKEVQSNSSVYRRPNPLSVWGSVAGYCIFIFFLSAQSDLSAPQAVPFADKAAHLLLYAGLGWLWARAVHTSWPKWTAETILVSTFAFVTLYGLSDEWHQLSVLGRFAELEDVGADACGGLLGGIGYLFWLRFRGKRAGTQLAQ